MARYAAFLRGVMPTNCKMPALKAAFEAAGFTEVRTLLASGNVVFTARTASSALRRILETDPYKSFPKRPQAKRIELDGARILALRPGVIFSDYMPNPKGPVFMTLIEKTFGKEVTTRTWDTVAKCAR